MVLRGEHENEKIDTHKLDEEVDQKWCALSEEERVILKIS